MDEETPLEVLTKFGINEVLDMWVMDGDACELIKEYINQLEDELNQIKRKCVSNCFQD
jgi:hypothetical protein